MLSFFPRGVLDEILNLIESVSEGFPSYSHIHRNALNLSMNIARLSDSAEFEIARRQQVLNLKLPEDS